MMSYIKVYNRADRLLFPEKIDEYVSGDNVVRLIDAFVDSLLFEEIGFLRAIPAKEGRPGYDPRDLLKLYIYGYFYRIRSSRRLEREVGRNIELIWMLGKIKPDFRTIADFRKDNKGCLKKVFSAFNKFCDKSELYSKEYVAIDGSKFRAVNSKDNNFTNSKLDDRLKRLDAQIEEYLTLLDGSDSTEETQGAGRNFTAEEVKEKIGKLKERKEKYEGIQKQLETTGASQVSLTDPESKLMKSNNGGFDVSYNVQTAIDAGSHLIAGFEVTDHPSDHGLLQSVSQAVKDDFGLKTIETTADKGYQDTEDMMNCLEDGIIPHVIPPEGKKGYELETVYEERNIGAEQKASLEPEDLKACLRAGVIPDIYKDTIMSIEVIEKTIRVKGDVENNTTELTEDEMKTKAGDGNFVRDIKRNLVYCPCNQILRQKTERKNGVIRYWNKLACAQCDNKCTVSKSKTVDFSSGAVFVACNTRQQSNAGSVPPKGKTDKQKCSNRKETKKVVRLFLKVDKIKCENRKCLSEHPFGTVKRALDSSYLLLKGKVKVTAELSLTFLAYNIRRAVNIMGVRKLMSALTD
jgi:transposase